ncbi:MAG: hypothetical protein RIT04_79 [Candidatus Parcubacteria bacterium]|jgi:hypothetical protein
MKFGTSIIAWLHKNRFGIISFVAICAAVGLIEFFFGRSPLGPDGHFGWWEPSIWSSENSQRVADAYTFSHIIHGMLFYGLGWLIARKFLPEHWKNRFTRSGWFLLALLLEGGWEILENSPIIIDRYREATIAVGYVGDSILNSVSDVIMMSLGFLIARLTKVWVVIVLIVVFELGCLWWVRDNLTLNVIMLVHPSESIKTWQGEVAPKVD